MDAHLANGYYFKTVAGLRFCRTRNFEDEVKSYTPDLDRLSLRMHSVF